MVLEDLDASGCRFASPDDDLDVAVSMVDELAALHATYWGQELEWLGTHALSPGDSPEAQKRMAMGAAIVQSAIDQFANDLSPEFRQLGELYIAPRDRRGVERRRANAHPRRQPRRQSVR